MRRRDSGEKINVKWEVAAIINQTLTMRIKKRKKWEGESTYTYHFRLMNDG